MADSFLNLGRLERVPLREVWAHEALGFTPWLAQEDNLQLLGEAIGMELRLEAREKGVGPFSADLLCKDLGRDQWVLVENQGNESLDSPNSLISSRYHKNVDN